MLVWASRAHVSRELTLASLQLANRRCYACVETGQSQVNFLCAGRACNACRCSENIAIEKSSVWKTKTGGKSDERPETGQNLYFSTNVIWQIDHAFFTTESNLWPVPFATVTFIAALRATRARKILSQCQGSNGESALMCRQQFYIVTSHKRSERCRK